MWEAIVNILSNDNSIQILIFLFIIVIIGVLLIKSNYLAIKTSHVTLGASEKERTILRQQTEWTYHYIQGLYSVIKSKYIHRESYTIKLILEKIYDECVVWIMFNHISRSDMYIMVKQEKLRGIVLSNDLGGVEMSEDFIKQMNSWTKEIVNRLVDIREYYK